MRIDFKAFWKGCVIGLFVLGAWAVAFPATVVAGCPAPNCEISDLLPPDPPAPPGPPLPPDPPSPPKPCPPICPPEASPTPPTGGGGSTDGGGGGGTGGAPFQFGGPPPPGPAQPQVLGLSSTSGEDNLLDTLLFGIGIILSIGGTKILSKATRQ